MGFVFCSQEYQINLLWRTEYYEATGGRLQIVKKSYWDTMSRSQRRWQFMCGNVYVKNDGMDQVKYDFKRLGDDSLHYKVDMTMAREVHGMHVFYFISISIFISATCLIQSSH